MQIRFGWFVFSFFKVLLYWVQALRPEKVQKILDECLLTDEEMAMGVDGWKATLGDVYLDMQDDEDEEEDEWSSWYFLILRNQHVVDMCLVFLKKRGVLNAFSEGSFACASGLPVQFCAQFVVIFLDKISKLEAPRFAHPSPQISTNYLKSCG